MATLRLHRSSPPRASEGHIHEFGHTRKRTYPAMTLLARWKRWRCALRVFAPFAIACGALACGPASDQGSAQGSSSSNLGAAIDSAWSDLIQVERYVAGGWRKDARLVYPREHPLGNESPIMAL